MTHDWAAVARAIDQRINELGWRQRQLAERSRVSQAIVRELHHHTVERRRSARTLEALSVALGWHPQHLDAVAHQRRPPDLDEPVSDSGDTLWSRMDALDDRLSTVTDRLDELRTDVRTVIKLLRAASNK